MGTLSGARKRIHVRAMRRIPFDPKSCLSIRRDYPFAPEFELTYFL